MMRIDELYCDRTEIKYLLGTYYLRVEKKLGLGFFYSRLILGKGQSGPFDSGSFDSGSFDSGSSRCASG